MNHWSLRASVVRLVHCWLGPGAPAWGSWGSSPDPSCLPTCGAEGGGVRLGWFVLMGEDAHALGLQESTATSKGHL